MATGKTGDAGAADAAPEAGADGAAPPPGLPDAGDARPGDGGDGDVADVAPDADAHGAVPPPDLPDAGDARPGDGGDGDVADVAPDADADGAATPPDLSDAGDARREDAADAALDSGLGLVGYVRSTTGTALALRVQGFHVYLGDWGLNPVGLYGRGNLQDYDVSDPARPVLQDSLYLCDRDCELGDISGDDSRLFVAGDVLGVIAFDLLSTGGKSFSAPRTNPTGTGGYVALVTLTTLPAPDPRSFLLVGAHGSPILDLYDVTESSVLKTPIQYPVLGGNAQSLFAMEARGQASYLLAETLARELKFEVVALSPSPGAVPVQLAELPWPKEKHGGPGTIKVQGDFVYVAASSQAPGSGVVGGFYGGLRVIDVSDPKHPFFAGTGLDLPSVGLIPWNGTGLDVDDTSVYFVTEKGLSVIDISTPTRPQLTASYPFPVDFPPCLGGRAMAKGALVYVAAFCQSADGLRGTGGLAIYRVR